MPRGIDTQKPIRMKATGRRLHVVWHEREDGPARGKFWVDLRDNGGRRGFRYNRDGTPFDEGCPWGEIENFEEGSPFESVETVTPQDAYAPEKLAAKRKAEHDAMVDELGDSGAWGLF
jgi:hypothetical protein